jgi:AcrR family transcriptional regulator
MILEPATIDAAPEDRRQKCEAIEAAALALFVEQGFHGTTVPEIARRAGVGTGTLYLYHASKDDLLNALYVRWNTTLLEGVTAAAREAVTARERFGSHWRAAVEFGDRYPVAFQFLMAYCDSPYLSESTRGRMEALKAPLVALFHDGIEQRVFKPLPPALLHAVCHGVLREARSLATRHKIEMTAALWRAAETMVWDAISI